MNKPKLTIIEIHQAAALNDEMINTFNIPKELKARLILDSFCGILDKMIEEKHLFVDKKHLTN